MDELKVFEVPETTAYGGMMFSAMFRQTENQHQIYIQMIGFDGLFVFLRYIQKHAKATW